jgi:hypothetical protein
MKKKIVSMLIVVAVVEFLAVNCWAKPIPAPDGGTTSLLLGGVVAGLATLRRFVK